MREVERAPAKLETLFGSFFYSIIKLLSNPHTFCVVFLNFCVIQSPSKQWFTEFSDEEEKEGVLVKTALRCEKSASPS